MVLFLHLFYCGLILIKGANKLAKFEERTYLKGKANDDMWRYRVTAFFISIVACWSLFT